MSEEKPVNIQQKEICISVSYFRFCLTRKIVAFILGCLSLINTVCMPSPTKKKKKKETHLECLESGSHRAIASSEAAHQVQC